MYNKKRYKSCLRKYGLVDEETATKPGKKLYFQTTKAQLATSYFFIWVDTNNLASWC